MNEVSENSIVWRIDQLPLAVDNSPIIEVGAGWPDVEIVGAGDYLPAPDGPLDIVWKRALSTTDDFCWPMMQHSPAIKVEVAEQIADNLRGFSLIDTQYIKDFGLRAPSSYEQVFNKKPRLKFLFVTHCLDADEYRSTIVQRPIVDAPDQIGTYVNGIEERRSIVRPGFSDNWHVQTIARKPGHGLYIHKQDIEGFDFFRINQNRRSTYCTDRARDFILGKSFTGVDFLEVGQLI